MWAAKGHGPWRFAPVRMRWAHQAAQPSRVVRVAPLRVNHPSLHTEALALRSAPPGHTRARLRGPAQVRRRTQQRVTSLPAGELLLISAMAVVWMAMLAWAVWAQRLPLWAVGAALGLNLFTFLAYASDKSAAQRGVWRTKESHLHLLALAGGWPAAWLAQQMLRHKSQKTEFRAVYALTVVAHCAALAAWLLGLVG